MEKITNKQLYSIRTYEQANNLKLGITKETTHLEASLILQKIHGKHKKQFPKQIKKQVPKKTEVSEEFPDY